MRSLLGGWLSSRKWSTFKTKVDILCRREFSRPRNDGALLLYHHRRFTSQQHQDELYKYMKENLDIEESLHFDILTALQMVYGNDVQVETLASLSKEDLQALAVSVPNKKQTPKQRPSRMVHIEVPHQNISFDLQWRLGESLLDLAKRDDAMGVHIEGTCGGQMACRYEYVAMLFLFFSSPHASLFFSIDSTCHVYLDKETLQHVPDINEIEWDLLEMAFEPNASSRLGCQIRLDPELMALKSITVTIPAGINNVWDD
mmetsp:Transcript_11235/g.21428  ORF Transcript_11235/g.21428 Transcript_11235/m.21428 type:complete len:258 (-) Transcript_11235:622-1395(-)